MITAWQPATGSSIAWRQPSDGAPLLLLFLYSNPSSFSSQTNRACTSPQPCQQKGSTAFFPLFLGLSKRTRCIAQSDWMLSTRDAGQSLRLHCALWLGFPFFYFFLITVRMSHHIQVLCGCLILSLVDCTWCAKMQASHYQSRETLTSKQSKKQPTK